MAKNQRELLRFEEYLYKRFPSPQKIHGVLCHCEADILREKANQAISAKRGMVISPKIVLTWLSEGNLEDGQCDSLFIGTNKRNGDGAW